MLWTGRSKWHTGLYVWIVIFLYLEKEETAPNILKSRNVKLEILRRCSIPESITYLDNAVLYIGSRLGDSQLIRLKPEFDENGEYIEILETYTNLGPIVDMCVVDLEKQGQGQLVTCSGAFKEGTLRIVRNVIGITEIGKTKAPGVIGVWSLRVGLKMKDDDTLVCAYSEKSGIFSTHGYPL